MDPAEERSEIAFFDLETTRPSRAGQVTLLEFGAILVCPRRLEELHHYSTLIGPAHPSLLKSFSDWPNGITQDAVNSAPSFAVIADTVFDILDGRIWAGHNIVKFDWVIIKKAFAEIGRPAPEPKATIDSLSLLTQRFGRRAGDMKMASLATYFRLGEQTHRSLDDVRMNLKVIKNCATVLFLESSLPDIFTEGSSGNAGYIEPEEVSSPYITASFFPLFNGSEVKIIKLLHKGDFMQLCCPRLKVRFGIRIKFHDDAGTPKLNFVVDSPPSLSRVLDACDDIAQEVIEDSGSNSEWRPILTKKSGFFPTARLHIPTEVIGDVPQYATEIHQKEAFGTVQKLVFHKFDPAELDSLFKPGTIVDAFISLDPYDYQQSAGIRLVAKKLIVHSD